VDADEVKPGEERKRDGHKYEEDECGSEEKDAWNAERARHGCCFLMTRTWLSSLFAVSSLLSTTNRSCTLNGGEEGEREALKERLTVGRF